VSRSSFELPPDSRRTELPSWAFPPRKFLWRSPISPLPCPCFGNDERSSCAVMERVWSYPPIRTPPAFPSHFSMRSGVPFFGTGPPVTPPVELSISQLLCIGIPRFVAVPCTFLYIVLHALSRMGCQSFRLSFVRRKLLRAISWRLARLRRDGDFIFFLAAVSAFFFSFSATRDPPPVFFRRHNLGCKTVGSTPFFHRNTKTRFPSYEQRVYSSLDEVALSSQAFLRKD